MVTPDQPVAATFGMNSEFVTGSTLDVLVVAYNSEPTLPAMLRSVATHLPSGTRVLVWSNSDTTSLRSAVANACTSLPEVPVEILGDGSNIGFARACNSLARSSPRKHVLFLNPDAEVTRWPTLRALPATTIIAPLVFDTRDMVQETYGRSRTLWDEFAIRVLRRKFAPPTSTDAFDVGFVSGVALLVQRERFLQCGGFDPSYFMYYEDIDLGRRWRGSGGTLTVEPSFTVRHIGGASAKSDRLAALQRSQISAENYHRRWSGGTGMFRIICIAEGVLKSLISIIWGRVGRVDRRTQLAFAAFLFHRRARNTAPNAARGQGS